MRPGNIGQSNVLNHTFRVMYLLDGKISGIFLLDGVGLLAEKREGREAWL